MLFLNFLYCLPNVFTAKCCNCYTFSFSGLLNEYFPQRVSPISRGKVKSKTRRKCQWLPGVLTIPIVTNDSTYVDTSKFERNAIRYIFFYFRINQWCIILIYTTRPWLGTLVSTSITTVCLVIIRWGPIRCTEIKIGN